MCGCTSSGFSFDILSMVSAVVPFCGSFPLFKISINWLNDAGLVLIYSVSEFTSSLGFPCQLLISSLIFSFSALIDCFV